MPRGEQAVQERGVAPTQGEEVRWGVKLHDIHGEGAE